MSTENRLANLGLLHLEDDPEALGRELKKRIRANMEKPSPEKAAKLRAYRASVGLPDEPDDYLLTCGG